MVSVGGEIDRSGLALDVAQKRHRLEPRATRCMITAWSWASFPLATKTKSTSCFHQFARRRFETRSEMDTEVLLLCRSGIFLC